MNSALLSPVPPLVYCSCSLAGSDAASGLAGGARLGWRLLALQTYLGCLGCKFECHAHEVAMHLSQDPGHQ
eukprot:7684850-Alexandrium_andersonii.AAC.1